MEELSLTFEIAMARMDKRFRRGTHEGG